MNEALVQQGRQTPDKFAYSDDALDEGDLSEGWSDSTIDDSDIELDTRPRQRAGYRSEHDAIDEDLSGSDLSETDFSDDDDLESNASSVPDNVIFEGQDWINDNYIPSQHRRKMRRGRN